MVEHSHCQPTKSLRLGYLVPFSLLLFLLSSSSIMIHQTSAQSNSYYNTGFCSQRPDGNYPDPFDCHGFYLCYNEGSQKINCQFNQIFSSDANRCEFGVCAEDANIYNRMLSDRETGDPSFCASTQGGAKAEGFHADPQNCNKFYRCINGYTYSFTCPDDLFYNPRERTCDWPRNVRCAAGRMGSTPTPSGYPWNPSDVRTTRRPPIVNPWRPRPTNRPIINPWNPNNVRRTTRPPIVNPWNPRPTTPPIVHPWNPNARRTTTRSPIIVNPWTPVVNPYPNPNPNPNNNNQFGGCNKVVCYFVNWSQYRPGNGKQFPDDVDPNLCTHMIFAFAKLVGNKVYAFEWNDDKMAWAKGNFEKAIELKKINPSLKVLLAVGGWKMGSTVFSKMVSTPENRREFITTTIRFLRERKFDGIDVDWEYPAHRGSPPGDKAKHAALLTEMRTALDREAAQTGNERLLLTAAVGAGKEKIDDGYDVPVMNRMLDFINLMSYDLHGSWEQVTGHNSPLFADPSETGDDSYLNVDWATRYWIQNGASPSKLVLGLPLYGRTFKLRGGGSSSSSSSSNRVPGIGSPVSGKGQAGKYTREAGFLSYYEICEEINSKGGRGRARVERSESQRVPHLVTTRGDWVGYDDKESLMEKVKYAKQMNLGGVMVWDLSMDDFKGAFCNQGAWPLMKTIINQCRAP